MSLVVYPALRPALEKYADVAARAEPLRVTLHLKAGCPLAGYDPVHLDNLLAWAVLQEATAGQRLPNSSCPYALPVPLVCLWKSPDGLPLWASSVFLPASDVVEDVEYLHKRAMSGRWSAGNEKTGRLSLDTVRGRHMERRIPVPEKLCERWEAWCWGDFTEIERLLPRVAFVGKRRAAGLGEVRAWEVTPAPEMMQWTDALHRGGTLIRPVPMDAADALGLGLSGTLALLGWTPPQWKPFCQIAAFPIGTTMP